MIKKGDLRLGNLILQSNSHVESPVIVTSGHIMLFEGNKSHFNIHYRGMAINDDILLKLGFQKHDIYGDGDDREVFAKKTCKSLYSSK